MTVIVIAAGALYPSVANSYAQYKVRAATDAIRSGFVSARGHAAEEGRRYRFSVVQGKGNFRVAPDDPAYWSGSPPKNDEEQPALILEDTLPRGIRFTINDAPVDAHGDSFLEHVSPGQYTTVATFESDSTAESPGGGTAVEITVRLDGGGARPMVVTLRCLTATSTVKYAEAK